MSVCDANLAMAMAIAMKRPAASFPSRAAPARRLSPARPPLRTAQRTPRLEPDTDTTAFSNGRVSSAPASPAQPSPNDAVAIAAAPTLSPPIFSRQTNARSDTRLGSCRARLFPRTLMAGDTKYPGPPRRQPAQIAHCNHSLRQLPCRMRFVHLKSALLRRRLPLRPCPKSAALPCRLRLLLGSIGAPAPKGKGFFGTRFSSPTSVSRPPCPPLKPAAATRLLVLILIPGHRCLDQISMCLIFPETLYFPPSVAAGMRSRRRVKCHEESRRHGKRPL